MSTDHHLEDNADDQTRIPATPPHIRGRHPGTSAIAGSIAGKDLGTQDHLVDLVGPEPSPYDDDPSDRRTQVVRIIGAPIREGQTMEVREDGRVYPVDETAADLAEQLVDVAETAAAVDQVDHALDEAAPPAPDYDFAEAIAGMANRHLQGIGIALEVVEACAGCGCTNRRACVLDRPRSIGGGMHVRTCHWIATAPGQPPRCSKCGPTDQALEENPATIMGIRIHRDDQVPAGQLHLRDDQGNTLVRITNIAEPSDGDVADIQVGLLEAELQPYAAAETMTAEREDDEQPDPLGETARRRP